ncbi:MAG: hypothetical protein M3R55_18015 [Acidobacteriota bacterium]|nr:hypothetical protein [Acidobacteriota bacterium]
MSKTAMHLRSPVGGLAQTAALCGTAKAVITPDYLAVTCRRCKAASKTGKHRRDLARAKLARLASEVTAAPFVSGSPVPYPSAGVWKLEPGSVDVLAREAGSDRARPIPRFPSIAAAVQRWAAHVDEGAGLRNSLAGLMKTEDGDRIRGTAPAGRVSNVERSVDDVVGVARAINRAFAGGMTWDGPPRVYLSPALCREIWTQRHAGRPAFSSKRRECIQRHETTAEDLRVMAAQVSGHEVTLRHIAIVMRQGNGEVREMLERSGELAPQWRSA